VGSRFRFWIDHVVPKKHRGTDDLDNLALACGFCNRHQGSDLAGIDPVTAQRVWLFNPRKDPWRVHFVWQDARIEGITPTGRATVAALAMNAPAQIVWRQALRNEGWLPERGPENHP
jgi:hypothetical protein